ncbi:MAG: SusD/RagB family nutrient-binding outer membrane lipoprotein [Bacteroidales bacterium]|nr:SusD/RagB family nutrient-binding outer membrane lipoprotein [Bacteroidales bacterium]
MAEVQLVEQVNSIDQNQNISRLLARYNSQTTYYGESQWNFYDRSLPDEMWETLYRDVLLDFKEVRRLIDLDQSIEAAAYLSQPEIGYETGSTANDFRKKIGLQKWIALYNRGLEGWAEWRRFDTPVFNIARNKTIDDIPMRMPYPYNENNLNLSNYTVASNAIGGDLVSTKLFWDIY